MRLGSPNGSTRRLPQIFIPPFFKDEVKESNHRNRSPISTPRRSRFRQPSPVSKRKQKTRSKKPKNRKIEKSWVSERLFRLYNKLPDCPAINLRSNKLRELK
ncbi:hypothetical protein AA313_de0206440 [Arthrobotrys entomopaga]|nr:hypothetical protein AA313_de0206440 [Arthrobotrys entomopaga]